MADIGSGAVGGINPRAKHIALVTYRRDGTAVPTPVWFAGGPHRLRVTTAGRSAKVKRIRNRPDVLIAQCDVRGRVLGPFLSATAHVLGDAEEPAVRAAIAEKYGWRFALVTRIERLFSRDGGTDRVGLEVTLQPETQTRSGERGAVARS